MYFVRDDYVRERYENEHPGWIRGKKKSWDKNGSNDNGHGQRDGNGHANGIGKGR